MDQRAIEALGFLLVMGTLISIGFALKWWFSDVERWARRVRQWKRIDEANQWDRFHD